MIAAPPLEGVIAAALEKHRDRCNALVAEARRARVDFDVDLLEVQIRGPLRAAAEACEALAPGSGTRVVGAIFGPVVDLVGQHRVGGGSHASLMAALPALTPVLVEDPRLVFASLANAVLYLQRFALPVDVWLNRVVAAAAASRDVAAVLRTGQVAAWTVGAAHFRDGALQAASSLSDRLFGVALDHPVALPVAATVEHLRADRWWRPGQAPTDGPAVAHRVGGFRGFGGPFLSPPRLGTRDGRIVVQSDEDAWLVHADAWGATLTRTSSEGVGNTPPASPAIARDVVAMTSATSYDVLVVPPGR